MWPAQPHPQGQGTAMATFLAGLEGERLALPQPRVGEVQRLEEQLVGTQGLMAGAERHTGHGWCGPVLQGEAQELPTCPVECR